MWHPQVPPTLGGEGVTESSWLLGRSVGETVSSLLMRLCAFLDCSNPERNTHWNKTFEKRKRPSDRKPMKYR